MSKNWWHFPGWQRALISSSANIYFVTSIINRRSVQWTQHCFHISIKEACVATILFFLHWLDIILFSYSFSKMMKFSVQKGVIKWQKCFVFASQETKTINSLRYTRQAQKFKSSQGDPQDAARSYSWWQWWPPNRPTRWRRCSWSQGRDLPNVIKDVLYQLDKNMSKYQRYQRVLPSLIWIQIAPY